MRSSQSFTQASRYTSQSVFDKQQLYAKLSIACHILARYLLWHH